MERLEERTLLSTIFWANRGTAGDGFDAAFGAGEPADAARAVVDAAVNHWERVITSFNYTSGPANDTLTIDVVVTANNGCVASANHDRNGNDAIETTEVDPEGRPRGGRININRGPFFIDATPDDNSEYLGAVDNAFSGTPTPGGPAAGTCDLYSLMALELTHIMGISTTNFITQPAQELRLQTGGFVTDTGMGGNEAPGNLWTFIGPTISALLTGNNGGNGGNDFNAAIHSAEPGNTFTLASGLVLSGSNDTGNAVCCESTGLRYLPSNLDALILKDAYDYDIIMPETFGTFYAVLNETTGLLTVRGGTNNGGDPQDDVITIVRDGDKIVVSVDVEDDVPGTGPDDVFVSVYDAGQVQSIVVNAGDGNDIVTAASDLGLALTINGDAGNDTLIGGDVTIVGGAGNDYITGSVGPDSLVGGDGNDTILGFEGNDTLEGGNDDDQLFAGQGVNTITQAAADGNDLVDLSENSVAITYTVTAGNDTVIGTAFDDDITGAGGADRLEGRGGDDTLSGMGATDELFGDDGADILHGGDGNDFLRGGADGDSLRPGATLSREDVDGGSGEDELLYGPAGTTVELFASGEAFIVDDETLATGVIAVDIEHAFITGLGSATSVTVRDLVGTTVESMELRMVGAAIANTITIEGSNVADDIGVALVFDGASSSNQPQVTTRWGKIFVTSTDAAEGDTLAINGLDGDDVIKANPNVNADLLISLAGGLGDDFLSADATLIGGAGNDTLVGGAGGDSLSGGDGDDTFVHNFTANGGTDTVDGGPGGDTILVVGTDASETITLSSVGPAGDLTVTVGAFTVTYTDAGALGINGAGLEHIEVFGKAGNDTFNVTPLPTISIFVDGGDPIGITPPLPPPHGDTLVVVIGANPAVFSAGPEADEGGIVVGANQPVSFDHIEKLGPFVGPGPVPPGPCPPFCPIIILGTNGDDDITIIARDSSTHPGTDGVQDFTVSVNEGPEILFINQPALVVDALSGDDDIVLRTPAPNNAPWNVDVTVIGGPPSAVTGDQGDVFEVETPGNDSATPGPDSETVIFTPTGPETGEMVITRTSDAAPIANIHILNNLVIPFPLPAPPLPAFYVSSPGGIEELVYDGEAEDDVITINGTPGHDTTIAAPTDLGDGTFESDQSPPFRFSDFSSLTVNGGTGGFDLITVLGTEGVDAVTSTASVITFGGALAGSVTIGAGMDRVDLLTLGGDDTIDLDLSVAGLTKLVDAGAGNDTVDMAGAIDATIFGGLGDDLLTGTLVADYIYGDDSVLNGGGNDTIFGLAGNDTLYGGDGNDSASGNTGTDQFFGGAGSDRFTWNPGDGSDLVEGGAGDSDELQFLGGAGANVLEIFGGGVFNNTAGGFFTPDLLQNASRSIFVLNVTAVFINMGDVEHINIDAQGAADQIIINNQVDVTSAIGTVINRGTDLKHTTVRGIHVDLGTADAAADNVEVHGRLIEDNVDVTTQTDILGNVTVDVAGFEYSIRIDQSAAATDELILHGQTGDDDIKAWAGVESTIALTLNGNDGDDFLSADATLNGGAGADFLEGGPGADVINGGAGEDTMIGLGGADTFDGGADFDTILIPGTSGNDLIVANQTADTTLVHTVNGATETDTLVLAAGVRTVERARIEAGDGDDVVTVTWLDSLGVDAAVNSLRFDVVGGADFTRDRLGVIDGGTGDLVLYRKGESDSTGSMTVGPANAEPLEAVFQGIEYAEPVLGVGGQAVVFKHDPFEFNNSQFLATHLGADHTINVDPTIDPGANAAAGLPADQDFYRFEAQVTGTLDLQVFFEEIPTVPSGRPGLPGGGNLNIELFDRDGTLIAGAGPAFGGNDGGGVNPELNLDGEAFAEDERIRIPAVQGQVYYLRAFGVAGAINNYTMTIVNEAPPVPYDIELDDFPVLVPPSPADLCPLQPGEENSDTGRSQFDNVTCDATPVIRFRLDDAIFLHDLPGNPANDTPPDEVIPIPFQPLAGAAGYRVPVFIEGQPQQGAPALPQVPIGFARQIFEGVYEFDFDTDSTDPAFFLTDGSHFINARVQMIDPATPAQTGFGDRSLSLEIIVDTVEPNVFFGSATVTDDGLESDTGVIGQPNTFVDRITSDVTPTFSGTAEANAVIRVYASDADGPTVQICETVAVPLDGTNQFPNGQWECTSTVDLNDPQFFSFDDVRHITVTAEDLAGNVGAIASLDIFIDTQGPRVTAVEFVPVDPALGNVGVFDPKPTAGPTPLTAAIDVTFFDQTLRPAISAQLTGGQEVPPNSSPATGFGVFTLNAAQTELDFEITYSGLIGGPLVGAHFHDAPVGVNGPIVRTVDISAATSPNGTLTGTWRSTDAEPLTAALVAELFAGDIYFNIHTSGGGPPDFPGGEIRGQLSVFNHLAVNELLATTPGNYQLVGDQNGHILIESVEIIDTGTGAIGGGGGGGSGGGTGGNLWLTGHDADLHCTGGEQCGYFAAAVNFVRAGSALPVLLLDRLDLDAVVALDAAFGVGVVPRVVVDPRAAFAATPLVDAGGNPLFSAIIVASDITCGGCDLNEFGSTPDSDAINARAADIATFFNAGGGIFALAGAENRDVYYDFLPIPTTAAAVSAPFTVTPRGAAVGITDAEANCCPTHNSFALPPAGNALEVAETDSAGLAETVIAEDAMIGGGGFIGGIAGVTATVRLHFATPLPDDRFTLTVFERIQDDAGNALDGDPQAESPGVDADLLPSGDGVPGDDFEGRFTVDSRPEVGTFCCGSWYIDLNGNGSFDDPNNHDTDYTNGDIVYKFGLPADFPVVGDWDGNGFDEIGVYGRRADGFRFELDLNSNGTFDVGDASFLFNATGPGSGGRPVAGRWNPGQIGDHVAVFNGTTWFVDLTVPAYTPASAPPATPFVTAARGRPIAADFNGDGDDDVGLFRSTTNIFSLDFTSDDDFQVDTNITFGFNTVNQWPVAADWDADRDGNIGLFVTDRNGMFPSEAAEWYLDLGVPFTSGTAGPTPLGPLLGTLFGGVGSTTANPGDGLFQPPPTGGLPGSPSLPFVFQDIFYQFGDQLAEPIVGNFDPPAGGGDVSGAVVRPLVRQDHASTPNDAATPLFVWDGAGKGNESGSIEVSGDRDVFRFTPTESGRITIDATKANSNLMPSLTVLSTSTTGKRSGRAKAPKTAVGHVELSVVAGQTYYLQVSGFRGSMGDYALAVDQVLTGGTPGGTPGGATGDDHGNTAQTGTRLNLASGTTTRSGGKIATAGDVDFFVFSPTVNGRLDLNVVEVTKGLNTAVDVFDSNGVLIATNDDAHPKTRNSRVTMDVVAGQTYSFSVRALSARRGDYSVALDLLLAGGL